MQLQAGSGNKAPGNWNESWLLMRPHVIDAVSGPCTKVKAICREVDGVSRAWFHQLCLRCTFVRCERRFQICPCHVLPDVDARGGGELVADVVVEADVDRHGL